MSVEDINAQVDYTGDIDESNTNSENNGGTRQAGSEEAPTDIRSLLKQAAEGEITAEDAGRARGPDGKFVAKDTNAPPAPADNTPAPPADPNAPPAQQEYKPNLEQAELEALNLVPEANRAPLLKAFQVREAAYYNAHNAAVELLNRNRGYESIEAIVGPRRQQLAMQGATVESWLTQIASVSDFAERQPAEFLQWYAGQRGIDLKQLSEDFIPPDPHLQALQTELAQMRSYMGQQQSYQQNQVVASTIDQVAQFANENDATGNKVRPYFNEVERDLVNLLPGIRQQNPGMHPLQALQTAYDQAVWANPNTRVKLQAAADAQRTREATERAAKARNAGSSVVGGPNNGTSSPPPSNFGTVREALSAAIAQHGG
jgi:hypothetical protein